MMEIVNLKEKIMKKILLLTVLFFCLPVCAEIQNEPLPRWGHPDLWRKRLREGLPEAGVINILGQPIYSRRTSDSLILFFELYPTIKTNKKGEPTVDYYKSGIVVLIDRSNKKNGSPKYFVDYWKEPDFTKIESGEYDRPESPKKLKPKRKIQPYEKDRIWKRLRFRLNDQSVRRLLGEPTRLEKVRGTDETKFYYEFEHSTAELVFHNGVLYSWNEPFWIPIEKELYEEVKDIAPPPTGADGG